MSSLTNRLQRLFGMRPARLPAPFVPLALGPDTSEPDPGDSDFTIRSGQLAGHSLRLEVAVQSRRADFFLWPTGHQEAPDSPIAHCHYDRDPDGTEILWDIFVHPDWRGKGLAALLVRLSLRRLLLNRRHSFRIRVRKLMQIDTGSGSRTAVTLIRLQNIGIGLIAVRLGLVPEPGLEEMLAPANISVLSIIPASEQSPPGYLFRLRQQPGLVTVCRLDPDTGRPVADESIYRRFVSPLQLCHDCRTGRAIAGNIDYELTPAGADHCFRRIAATSGEYQHLLRHFRPHRPS